ncbi:MAG: DsbA family oxidoreductase, partial [Micromonosporaceae bacterium]
VAEVIQVDVWSDVVCPWCYIGKRRFEAGAAAFAERHPDVEVRLEYHSFQLDPDTPLDFEGTAVDYLVGRKGVSAAQARQMIDHVVKVAAEVGLAYDYDAIRHTNTGKAHQLLHHAKVHGRQVELKERLMRAYFVEGRHVGRDDDLADLAAEVGLDRDEAWRALRENRYADAVRADQEQAARYGIHAVPFFVLDGRYGISGAQPAEVFTEALAQVHRQRAAARP